jgi:outer membrane receptor protein involved in Fe transport
MISNSTSSRPSDKWLPSSLMVKPEVSDQFAVGYYRNLFDNAFELNVESYYKTMDNQIDYRDGAETFNSDNIETQLLYGIGRAYGLEVLFKKKKGDFTGWLSYTLSKTERQIDGINGGKWYNARQDRTHEVALVGSYQLNKRWSLSASWIYYTGDAITFPTGKYNMDGQVFFYYTDRNTYRMPSYHRLDLGANLQLKKRKNFSSELSFSLYNAYGRKNAYMINFREAENDPSRTEVVRTTLFQFLPSVSYNFKF